MLGGVGTAVGAVGGVGGALALTGGVLQTIGQVQNTRAQAKAAETDAVVARQNRALQTQAIQASRRNRLLQLQQDEGNLQASVASSGLLGSSQLQSALVTNFALNEQIESLDDAATMQQANLNVQQAEFRASTARGAARSALIGGIINTGASLIGPATSAFQSLRGGSSSGNLRIEPEDNLGPAPVPSRGNVLSRGIRSVRRLGRP